MSRMELGGAWSLIRAGDKSIRPIAIPGDIMSALVASGELADPYLDRNELAAQWVGREDWILARDFELDAKTAARAELFLDIDMLDSIGEVSVNGRHAGSCESMFTRLRLDVKSLLKVGSNRIEVLIKSPEKAAVEKAGKLPYPLPASTYPLSSPHRNLVRKAQCMSGWDWGPCLMTGGIYDGIALVALDGPRIDYVTTKTKDLGGGRWRLDVHVDLRAVETGSSSIKVEIAGKSAELALLCQAGEFGADLSLELDAIASWWPSDYGEQPLYELLVTSSAPGGAAGDSLRKKLGFRTLEVVSQADAIGRSLTFRINGRAIFAKGANWIPADALPSRWTRERLADLLGSAKAANMNMLRVWGGGRYESDAFYELCDELGLLVWQDAMFSCALYPSDPAFLGLVEKELRHQVRRLRDHASIALWCGNNEALGAIGWYEESKKNPARYVIDYDRLNEGTVGRVIRELDPDRRFWPSSPSAGPDDYSDNWHADTRGDMHYWTVWHEGKPFSAYLEVQPRFGSEFGFQSLPSYKTATTFAPAGELNVTSPAFEHHQRHPRGNSIIIDTMTRYFRMPKGFRETLWLSQVQQAMAIKTAVQYWRSLRDRCMGTLYWQLNDVWPAASWSSLEYDGSWKILHHEAKRFYDPVMVALYVKNGIVFAMGVNDSDVHIAGIMSIRIRRFDGSIAMDIDSDVDLPADSSTLLWKAPISDLPCRPEDVYLAVRLEASAHGELTQNPSLVFGIPSHSGGTAEYIRRNQLFLVEPKRCSLADPRIEREIVEEEGRPVLILKSRAPAFWVTAEVDGLDGQWSDAGFYMMGREERRLHFIPRHARSMPSKAELERATRITHLRASYE
ncbi:MAG TPA: glycoside hydrolase family 2 protein [Rectinemataceae bacterium]|nr:glycoside hydrolase family 2 protein [Rectinemataceae bacterium]